MKYYLSLDKNYNVDLGQVNAEIINNLETMLDNMIYLLQSYGVSEEEILEEIKNDTSINIKESD